MKKRTLFNLLLQGSALVAATFVAGTMLAGCPQDSTPNGTTNGQNPTGATEDVSLRLAWIPGPTFAGDYLAQEKGFWQKEGLKVEVAPGGFEFNAIKLVAGGNNDFGVSNLPQLLEARANGVPVVAIAAIIPRSPIGWVSKESSGITKPQQFVGKKVGAQFGTHTEVTFVALMNKLNINPDKVNRIPVKFDPKPFLEDQVQVLPVYITDQPYLLRSKGLKLNIIDPFDYGIDLSYGNLYFTTEKMIQEKPETVRKFVKGALSGWQYAIDNPDEAVKVTLAQDKTLNPEVTGQQLKATLEMMTKNSKKMDEIGKFDPARVEETIKILTQYGKLKKVNASETYTNDLLPSELLPAAE